MPSLSDRLGSIVVCSFAPETIPLVLALFSRLERKITTQVRCVLLTDQSSIEETCCSLIELHETYSRLGDKKNTFYARFLANLLANIIKLELFSRPVVYIFLSFAIIFCVKSKHGRVSVYLFL